MQQSLRACGPTGVSCIAVMKPDEREGEAVGAQRRAGRRVRRGGVGRDRAWQSTAWRDGWLMGLGQLAQCSRVEETGNPIRYLGAQRHDATDPSVGGWGWRVCEPCHHRRPHLELEPTRGQHPLVGWPGCPTAHGRQQHRTRIKKRTPRT